MDLEAGVDAPGRQICRPANALRKVRAVAHGVVCPAQAEPQVTAAVRRRGDRQRPGLHPEVVVARLGLVQVDLVEHHQALGGGVAESAGGAIPSTSWNMT